MSGLTRPVSHGFLHYQGAPDQHSGITNEAIREDMIRKDIYAQLSERYTRGRKEMVEALEWRRESNPSERVLEWLLRNYGVNMELYGKYAFEARTLDNEQMVRRAYRASVYVGCMQATYASDFHKSLADWFMSEIETQFALVARERTQA